MSFFTNNLWTQPALKACGKFINLAPFVLFLFLNLGLIIMIWWLLADNWPLDDGHPFSRFWSSFYHHLNLWSKVTHPLFSFAFLLSVLFHFLLQNLSRFFLLPPKNEWTFVTRCWGDCLGKKAFGFTVTLSKSLLWIKYSLCKKKMRNSKTMFVFCNELQYFYNNLNYLLSITLMSF